MGFKERKIFQKKYLFFSLIIFLMMIDFFIIARLDPICRYGQGYGFGYYLRPSEQQMVYQRYGWSRVAYNLKNFFQFWQKPPAGKDFSNLKEFLLLDVPPSKLSFNILHFFAFLIFAFLLIYFFRLPIWLVFLIGVFFNIFHEYVAEGICTDPSFNDLWVDTLGLLVGMLVGIVFLPKQNSADL